MRGKEEERNEMNKERKAFNSSNKGWHVRQKKNAGDTEKQKGRNKK